MTTPFVEASHHLLKRTFTRTLTEVAAQGKPLLSWRHHGLGMLQAELSETLRVHVWHPSLVSPGMTWPRCVHDHRFDITSAVIVGEVRDVVPDVREGGGPTHPSGNWQRAKVYEIEHAKNQDRLVLEKGCSTATSAKLLGDVILTRAYADRMYKAGSGYRIARRVFHTTEIDALAITVIHRSNHAYPVDTPGRRSYNLTMVVFQEVTLLRSRWELSSSSDRRALDVVDGAGPFLGAGHHYSRRSPGSKTFTGVGKEVVLVTTCGRAVWACVYQRTPSARGTGGSRGRVGLPDAKPRYLWRNMMFRNLGAGLSSDLIADATEATYREWLARYFKIPVERLRTEIGVEEVKSNNPGYCYERAGWEYERDASGRRVERNGKLFMFAPERA
jgi:hypothetical protein